MNTKLLTLMFGFIFMLSFISAVELTDTLTQIDSKTTINPFGYKKLVYEPITSDKYVTDDFMLKEDSFNLPVIRLSNTLLWFTTDKVAEYKVTDVKESIINVKVYGKAVLYKEMPLFDDALWYDLAGRTKDYVGDYYYKVTEEYNVEEIISYNEVCPVVKEDTKVVEPILNETNETTCEMIPVYENVTKEKITWKLYDGKNLPIGNYEWKFSGKKEINKPIDFVPSVEGVKLDEYVWFNDSWDYRREISNLTGNISGLYTIPYNANMQVDFEDLRFVNDAGTIEYNVSNVSQVNSDWISLRLNVPDNDSVLMYYGNSEVSAIWNMSNVLLNPIYAYLFDGSAKDYVGGNDGTVTNAILADGYINQSYDFDGTGDYIDITGLTSTAGSYTYSYWLKPETLTGLDWIYDEELTRFVIDISGGDNGGVISYNLGGSWYGYGVSATTGTWKNYMFVFDAPNSKSYLYIDGVKQVTEPAYSSDEHGGTSVKIGSSYDGTSNFYDGLMDEVYIYDRVLTQTEITALYNQTAPLFVLGSEEQPNRLAVNSISPIDNYNSTSQSIDFSCNATDETGIYSLNLTVNGTVYETVTGDGTGNLTLSSTETIADGDNYQWFCIANDDINTKFSVNRTINVDATLPLINITSPTISYDYLYDNQTVDLNYSISDTNLDSCWYIYNGTTTSLNCSTNTTFQYISGINNITVYANDTYGNENNETISWTVGITEYSITANASVTETETETFKLSLVTNDVTSINSFFYFDGSKYSTTQALDGNKINISATIDIPTVETTDNLTYYYNITAVIDSVSTSIITNSRNVTVSNINVQLCNATFNNTFINYITKSATSPYDNINTTLSKAMNFYSSGGSGSIKEEFSYNDATADSSSFAFCVEPGTAELIVTSQVLADAPLYSPANYYLTDATLTNTTTNVTMYLLNDSLATATELIVRDSSQEDVEDALIYIQKYDVGTDSYLNIENIKTSSIGSSLVYLAWYDEFYKFIVMKNGEIVFSGLPEKIFATPRIFVIGSGYDDGDAFLDDVDYTLYFNNVTNNFVTTYAKPSGGVDSYKLEVELKDYSNNSVVCSVSDTSSSGTLYCSLGDEPANGTYVAKFIVVDTDEYIIESEVEVRGETILEKLNNAIGTEDGNFYTFLMTLLITLIMFVSPVLGIIGLIIGLIVSMLLGFTIIQISSLVGIAVIAGLISWVVRR